MREPFLRLVSKSLFGHANTYVEEFKPDPYGTERNGNHWLLYSFQSAFNGSNLIDLIYRINSVSVSLYIKRFDRLETATSYPRLLLRQSRVRCFWENRRTIKLEFKPFTLRQT